MTPISTILPCICIALHFTLLLYCEALPVQPMPRSTPVVVVVVVVVTCIHSNWHIAWCEAIERACGHAGHVVERGLCHTRPEPHAMKSRFGERKRRQVQPDMLCSLRSPVKPCTHYGEILCVLLLKFGNRIRLLLLALMTTNMICVAYMHNYTCVSIIEH